MWILETSESVSRARHLPPSAGSVKTIGRSPGAEFIVDAALVSRLHCQLTATADSLQVKDLDSTNGTFVNGKRVTTSPSCTTATHCRSAGSSCSPYRSVSRDRLQERIRPPLLPDRRLRTVARIHPRLIAEGKQHLRDRSDQRRRDRRPEDPFGRSIRQTAYRRRTDPPSSAPCAPIARQTPPGQWPGV